MIQDKKLSTQQGYIDLHLNLKELPGSVTICDKDGVIVSLNEQAVKQYQAKGGLELIGRSVFDCHPEPARTKLRELMASRRQNLYFSEQEGQRKIVFQSPWYVGEEYAGFLDITIDLPPEIRPAELEKKFR